jgi:O-antigen ligase
MAMVNEKKLSSIQYFVILGVIISSLIVTPDFSMDPINLPKMVFLSILAISSFSYFIISPKILLVRNYSLILILSLLFIIQLTLSLLFSGSPFNQQFYGTFGRSTGFITYLSLTLLLLVVVFIVNANFTKILAIGMFTAGVISAVYGAMQTLGVDPVPWKNQYNAMISFFGNPNFSSAFLGIVAAGSFAFLFFPTFEVKRKFRYYVVVYLLVSLILIMRSNSVQGLVVYFLGALVSLGLYIFRNSRINLAIKVSYVFFASLVLMMGTLGSLKIGLLSNFLYQDSVRQRGFYWQAARRMIENHPFFGVGLDSFGDWYYQYRSANAEYYSPTTATNSAHSILLDIGSTGGLPLLALHLAISIYIAMCAFKLVKNTKEIQTSTVFIIIAWLAYEAQSFISINQIGIGIWGWVLGGAIIGLKVSIPKSTYTENSATKKNMNQNKITKENRPTFLLPISVGMVVSLILVFPPLMADHNYSTAANSRDGNKVFNGAKAKPVDLYRIADAINGFSASNLTEPAIELAKFGIEQNPRYYTFWAFLKQLSAPDSVDRKLAIEKMKELNPQSSDIK